MEMITVHTLRRGERLEALSARYNVPVCMIMRANGMEDPGGVIGLGQIKIPRRCFCNRCNAQHQIATRYVMVTVQPEDSAFSIAKKFGITMHILLKTNGIEDPESIRHGDVLSIPVLSGMRYTVRPGESLKSIAQNQGVSEDIIREINCLEPDTSVYPGMLLILR